MPTTRLLDIGRRSLHIMLAGYGSPVVVMEAGMGDTLDTWTPVLQPIAEMATVVSYDRAGLGRSDPAPVPRSLRDMAEDLDALLAVASIPEPYVFVSHSFGSQIARLFAAERAPQVRGMVLIDPSHEDKYVRFESTLSDELIARQNAYLHDPSRNSEHIDLLESRLQLRAANEVLNGPLIVLSRGRRDKPSSVWPSEALHEIEMQLHRELLNMPGAGMRRHIVASNSGHYIHKDEPDLVVSAVRDAISAMMLGPE